MIGSGARVEAALGYSKTLEKPFGCSATLEKPLEKPLGCSATLENPLGFAQPLEKLTKKTYLKHFLIKYY